MTIESLRDSKDSAGLEAMVRRAMDDRNQTNGSVPPVEKWNPPFCGDLDMEIRRDGTWFYMGTPMGRPALVRLFSSILRKDEDDHTYLVTPVEKVRIKVEDAHFLAVEMNVEGEGPEKRISFRTNVGEIVVIDDVHPIWFEIEGKDAELKPYFRVRGRLDALVNRATMYDLVELGEEVDIDGQKMFALQTNGMVIPIMPMADLIAQAN